MKERSESMQKQKLDEPKPVKLTGWIPDNRYGCKAGYDPLVQKFFLVVPYWFPLKELDTLPKSWLQKNKLLKGYFIDSLYQFVVFTKPREPKLKDFLVR